ncbi:GNAT family N-acetyltransferase [Marichromatium sp. AB31]|nr:GNAT family N-acetyltransferase [Marichromatium sp. AB31]
MWQVGVDINFRKKGIGKRMIKEILCNFEKHNIESVEFSVPPNNFASLKMFQKALSESSYQIKEMADLNISVKNINWTESHRHFTANLINQKH